MAAEVHLHDPQTLYRHWEEQQWSPFEVELDTDAAQWRDMASEDRDLVLWALSSLMVAEERITTKFSGLVGAYGSEEEATFLATQQVDEARHMLSPAFGTIFDELLVSAHERLTAEPGDAAAKVEFVALYHMVIEGTLGLTAFNFITRYLEDSGQLPGFVEGYSKIHHDEQRHIGYGTWFLRDAVGRDPALADSVRATLRAALPAVAEALTPPDREDTDWEALGASSQEIRDFAITGLTRRLNIVGVPLDSL
jgi:ribonucleoside-diphosphate reductase beta chain